MRVVAGVARGRRLESPPGRGTRPTSDRVREAVFNSLASLGAIDGARVVDLYAGSGAMGIEALSRGAESVVFVESDARAAGAIERNLASTGLFGGTVVRADAVRWLRGPSNDDDRSFDLAIADPPYAFGDWPTLLEQLVADVAVLESDRAIDPGAGWRVVRERRYGTTVVTIIAADEAAPRGREG